MTKAQRKYYRTIILGVAAMGALIWSAMDQFGISRQEMQSQFLSAVLVVAALVLCGACAAAVWIGLRKLFGRKD